MRWEMLVIFRWNSLPFFFFFKAEKEHCLKCIFCELGSWNLSIKAKESVDGFVFYFSCLIK